MGKGATTAVSFQLSALLPASLGVMLAVPSYFHPDRKGTVVRLQLNLLPPTLVAVTSERLLRCCPQRHSHCHLIAT